MSYLSYVVKNPNGEKTVEILFETLLAKNMGSVSGNLSKLKKMNDSIPKEFC